ncbi:sulfotransferase [uncultured Jannaschia sp.]|uniref:sulfotransferase family protein n=1 Tax=uncultured Jannaschia sp. TaxID=293347 RepID=UPI00262795B5|nr:sulfotransferase [uncultured Jannaschia sp.]
MQETTGPTAFAIIVGSMKSGSSSLFDLLRLHPALCPCSEKEPQYFSSPYQWGRGWDWYRGLYEGFDPTSHRYGLEASTDYAKLPYMDHVFERMKRRPDVRFRFVYIMRHPVARIVSHHKHAALTGYELGHVRPDRTDFSFDAGGVSPVAIDLTRYARHLDAYADAFGRDTILPVVFEDMLANQQKVLDEVCDFLEIAHVSSPDLPKSNEASAKFSDPTWRKLSNVRALRRLAHGIVPKSVRHRLYLSQSARSNALTQGRFEMRQDEEAWVLEELRDDLKRLREIYDIDVPAKWSIAA